jgi:hypothetical protein
VTQDRAGDAGRDLRAAADLRVMSFSSFGSREHAPCAAGAVGELRERELTLVEPRELGDLSDQQLATHLDRRDPQPLRGFPLARPVRGFERHRRRACASHPVAAEVGQQVLVLGDELHEHGFRGQRTDETLAPPVLEDVDDEDAADDVEPIALTPAVDDLAIFARALDT